MTKGIFAFFIVALAAAIAVAAQAPAATETNYAGPIVADCKVALDKGDVTPALKWVSKGDEAKVKELFGTTLQASKKYPEGKAIFEKNFFDTVSRLHAAGEGLAYAGLQTASQEPGGLAAAETAVESGSVDKLAADISAKITSNLKDMFAKVEESKKHADESVDLGRRYVEEYTAFAQYAQRIAREAAPARTTHKLENGPKPMHVNLPAARAPKPMTSPSIVTPAATTAPAAPAAKAATGAAAE